MRQVSKMKLHPFYECVERAEKLMERGADIYQQWKCAHCGVKQEMPDKNVFYILGDCEECKQRTDIQRDGCNYAVHYDSRKTDIGRVLKRMSED